MSWRWTVLWALSIGVFVGGVAVTSSGCAALESNNDDERAEVDVRGQVESEFGALDEEAIRGFERELQAQYEQLEMTYDDYDAVRRAPEGVADDDHEDHRLHRKLKRRHRTLARLHEDRMWLHVDDEDGSSVRDRQLAESHRAAAQWHDERFEDDGTGVEDQDSDLEMLREEFERTEQMFAE